VCGDDWTAAVSADRTFRLFVADGLGHGALARDASADATRVFSGSEETSPAAILEQVHLALRGGRGAAIATALLDPDRACVDFAGVGNIAGVVRSDAGSKSMVSHNGTAGHGAQRFRAFSYDWPEHAVVVLHSDGLTSHWTADAFPGLLRRHPSLIAAALHRDFARGRDDVTVIVARRTSELSA
jgi:serine phosphatase RsbU (regulator of sigma subunit)